jgi:intracellular sulfur oxidation DsrE/DsrF family protein
MKIRAWPNFLIYCLSFFVALSAQAEALNEDNPFAEKYLLLQVSSRDQHAAVLNIASNLQKYYGPDMIDIQVVTFAAGIELLKADNNPLQPRVESLQAGGVRFYVCQNTIDTLKQQRGVEFQSLESIGRVRSGVAYILEEVERGYTLVAP